MQKRNKWFFLFASFFAAFHAQAQLCSQSSDLPTGLKSTIDIVGTLPEEDLPKVMKNMLKAGDGFSTLADLNKLCGIVQNKDEVNAFLFGLDYVSKLTGAEVAPFVSVIVEIAGKEIDAIRAIASSEAFSNFGAPTNIRFVLNIKSYEWYGFWNRTLSPREAALQIASIDLLYADATETMPFTPLALCTDPHYNNCKNGELSAVAASDEQVGAYSKKPYMRIVFKNKQRFILPIMPGHVQTPNAFTFVFPFLLKDKTFRYNY